MNFKESIDWLYSFKKYGSKLGLERISYLVEKLDNPQKKLNVIHVTGTNGKGSVCKFIGSILQHAGYSVGIYISPHLERFSERIVINNEEISEENIVLLVEKIKPIVDEMIKKNNSPTFFEIITAMTFQFFYNSKVDFAVIEVGLGGRFDATNVVTPAVSVITNISKEHSQQLGEDLKSIAFEKAGIIKDNVPAITAAKNEGKEVIVTIAKEKKAPITVVDCDSWKRVSHTMSYQNFLISGRLNEYVVKTSLLGEYQGENIALAIAAIEQLQMKGLYVTDTDILVGISTTFHPGRMEIIAQEPTILFDGAHNPVGAEMLSKALQQDMKYDKLILVLGILKDKDIQKMLSSFIPIADTIIVTKSTNARACEPHILKKMIEKLGYDKEAMVENSLQNAVELAKKLANKHDMICVTGSLFTVGEARSYLFINSPKKILNS